MQNSKLQLKIQICSEMVLLGVTFLFTAVPVFAAETFFEAKSQEIAVGQLFEVTLLLNTEGEDINAIEGKIIFPTDLLELKEIYDGNSIINLWVERPLVNTEGQLVFSGITPGGYNGKSGLIFTMFFEAKQKGIGTIKILGARSLLSDGFGTEASLTITPFVFKTSAMAKSPPMEPLKDVNPPEPFTPTIARDETIFDNQWFLVFATQDKGLGIDHYEIHESPQRKTQIDTKWVVAESPYALQDQKLRSYIFVKAVDKAGNERVEMLLPQGEKPWYENYSIWVIVISGVAITFLVGRIIWKKYLKKPSKF